MAKYEAMTKPEARSAGVIGSARVLRFVLALVGSALLLLSLKLPLWQMRLEAPQYKDEEALKIAVYPNAFRGDLRELRVLNQYIGVHVPPTLPQFGWLPAVLIGGAVLGLAAAFLRTPAGPRVGLAVAGVLSVALLVAAQQAKSQMHDIGHKRDQKTILRGMHDFTPPFLGTTKIAQFTVSSRFGAGAYLIGAALVLQLGQAWLGRQQTKSIAQEAMAASSLSCKTLVRTGESFAGGLSSSKSSNAALEHAIR
jgi:hypothetical protein